LGKNQGELKGRASNVEPFAKGSYI